MLFSDPGDNNKDIEEHLLWVEKYSPKHYTELLSDDVCDITVQFLHQDKLLSTRVTTCIIVRVSIGLCCHG